MKTTFSRPFGVAALLWALIAFGSSCKNTAGPLVPVASSEEESADSGSLDDSDLEGEADGQTNGESESNFDGEATPETLVSGFAPKILGTSVANTEGKAPLKGDNLVVRVNVSNGGLLAGDIKIAPLLTSLRFSDFVMVPIAPQTVHLASGVTQTLTFPLAPFISDLSKAKKYALGRGTYQIDIEPQTGIESSTASGSLKFEIGKSNVVFTLLMSDKKYFTTGEGRSGVSPESWVNEAFTRSASVYYPATSSAKNVVGGFDAMLGVKHLYQSFDTLNFADSAAGNAGYMTYAEAGAKTSLGLIDAWVGNCPNTCTQNHGFDYMIALNPILMGSVAISGTQVTGAFDGDVSKNRSQLLLAHGTSTVFGAPACDPLQGYVMCGGELAASYKASGDFLWHENSLKAMNAHKFD